MPKHGGNIYQNPECSAEWLDFSANINPFGVPETVQHAIQRAVAALVHYPDPAQQKLRQALAEFHGRLPAEIVCGDTLEYAVSVSDHAYPAGRTAAGKL